MERAGKGARVSGLRAEVEELLFREAELLDAWKLREWLLLLTDDAHYLVPPNDKREADHRSTLFTVADDRARIEARVNRLLDPSCHAEYPPSRTRRLIGNVRVVEDHGTVLASANFIVHRFRRHESVRKYVGQYRYRLRREGGSLRIAERRAILDAEELGSLGSVSFIL
jgi:p-cumate 2,3-dioxygenase subunit beta